MKNMLAVLILGVVFAGLSWGETFTQDTTLTGPTLKMEYNSGGLGNDVDAFMYFIPLVMPTAMDVYTDPNTTLNAKIISRASEQTACTFKTTCIFQIYGQGVYEAIIEPNEFIAYNTQGEPKDKTLRNQLHSIRVDGSMKGSVVISGSIRGNCRQVDKVQVRFDLDGKSCVYANLFEVKPVDGEYFFENRYNEQVARIDALSFSRGDDLPRMETELSSVARAQHEDGLFASLKAMVANLFLSPVPISVIGNQTMLDFGAALDSTQTAFTFPYAENLRQNVKSMLAKSNHPTRISN